MQSPCPGGGPITTPANMPERRCLSALMVLSAFLARFTTLATVSSKLVTGFARPSRVRAAHTSSLKGSPRAGRPRSMRCALVRRWPEARMERPCPRSMCSTIFVASHSAASRRTSPKASIASRTNGTISTWLVACRMKCTGLPPRIESGRPVHPGPAASLPKPIVRSRQIHIRRRAVVKPRFASLAIERLPIEPFGLSVRTSRRARQGPLH